MIARLIGGLVLVWAFGFLWFANTLPGPAVKPSADAIIVPTGAAGRINRGLELLGAGKARQMLVTGVDPEVKPREFAAEYDVPASQMDCCIVLGSAAADTQGNAQETAAWLAEQEYSTLLLVTSDWHMARSLLEMERQLPANVTIIPDAVITNPDLEMLFREYNKLIAAALRPYLGL